MNNLYIYIAIFFCILILICSYRLVQTDKNIYTNNNYIYKYDYPLKQENYEPKTYILPKTIFAYYDDLEKSKIIMAHHANWKKKFKGWNIIFLDKQTVMDYLEPYEFDYYTDLGPVQFSDYLRFALLKRYGGVWLDAGIIIFDGNFIDNYYNEMIKYKYDACVYEFKKETVDPSTPHLENWFIMAPKDSRYINDIYNEYVKAIQMKFINYKADILVPSGVNLTHTIGYRDRTYLIQHAIINYLMFTGKKYNINIKIADESMYKYASSIGWKHHKIIDHIIMNDNWKNIYAYKLTGATRKAITPSKINHYIKKINSI